MSKRCMDLPKIFFFVKRVFILNFEELFYLRTIRSFTTQFMVELYYVINNGTQPHFSIIFGVGISNNKHSMPHSIYVMTIALYKSNLKSN